jgi:glutaredoxin
MRFLAIALLLVIGSSLAWAGDLYKWNDEKGVTRYSDQAPPPGAKNVHKYRVTGGGLVMEKPAPALQETAPPAAEKPAEQAAEKLPITVYSFDECGDVCKQAEALLDKRGVPYTRKGDNNAKIELQKLTGKLDVPVMVIGNTAPISGFQEERWNRELDMAGYGKNPAKPGGAAASGAQPQTQKSRAAANQEF